jgi:enoyl-CoA hydratase/carnithine racemase
MDPTGALKNFESALGRNPTTAPARGRHGDMNEDLLFKVEAGIAQVVFDRPRTRNALTSGMYEGLTAICAKIDADPSIKVLILTGAGDQAFASGTDISEFRQFASPDDILAYEARIEATLSALERCSAATIAAIAGVCTGGGAMIAACCDLRIGEPETKLGMPIARTLGNCLSMSNYARLAALIGPARVKDLILTARLVGAKEAMAMGLLNETVDQTKELLPRAHDLGRRVAAHAPLTLRATKEALLRLRGQAPQSAAEDLVLMCYLSEDFREGVAAFLEKRSPRWRGV